MTHLPFAPLPMGAADNWILRLCEGEQGIESTIVARRVQLNHPLSALPASVFEKFNDVEYKQHQLKSETTSHAKLPNPL